MQDGLLLNITRDTASRLAASSQRKVLASEIEYLQVLRYGGEFKVHWDASWKDSGDAALLPEWRGRDLVPARMRLV